jgi:hypothetical protein
MAMGIATKGVLLQPSRHVDRPQHGAEVSASGPGRVARRRFSGPLVADRRTDVLRGVHDYLF